jgi:hypothetical protein
MSAETFQAIKKWKITQDISQIEKRYSDKWSPYMLAEYCWSLTREIPRQKQEVKDNEANV